MALVPFPSPGSTGALKKPTDDEDDEDALGGRMSFLEHLEELRKRIIYACYGIGAGVAFSFLFIQKLFEFLTAPAIATLPPGSTIIYTQPTEAFALYINISLIAGAVFASPFIMYQVWQFIAPGLYATEKKFVVPFVLLTTIGFLAGAAFNHYVAYRFVMTYFASFNALNLKYMPQLSEVFGLYLKMLIGLGLIFQMPTVVFFLAKVGAVSAKFLLGQFKYATLIIFILAAIVTPTGDPMTLMVFALPMMGLYLLSIAIAWLVGPKRLKDATA